MKIRALLLAAGLAVSASAALGAEPTRLLGDELRKAISGKTVYLNVSGFELPIRYASNGRMKGSMGTIAASFSRGDGASDSGKWWVANDRLCQKWTSWMDSKTFCYQLTRQGKSIVWLRSDGRRGTARLGG
jgi:hypothetical protein